MTVGQRQAPFNRPAATTTASYQYAIHMHTHAHFSHVYSIVAHACTCSLVLQVHALHVLVACSSLSV